ncbi:cell wall-binding repeat-containing protein [Coriobacteriia bacterium Es71-Z0120]|uniref:cell wall-binding repeat-containing protein n=1 Tax=Parvivirga hydrogeniphila TaxID=2939460 RepID=UPI002260C4A5|nr:cell wall-binding repeat-containing protein [Parvivirga hydrogeniphila]MCL4078681.1 cell wall-binding repeat-containing protein [Parvivirga hydrogeniphila]
MTLSLLAAVTGFSSPARALHATAAREIWVSPEGDDATGDGTRAKPFRSITKGIAVSATGDTVWVMPGDYSTATGEVFPLFPKSGTSIKGFGPTRPRVVGDGANPTFTLLDCNEDTILDFLEMDGDGLTASTPYAGVTIWGNASTGGPRIFDCWIHDFRSTSGIGAGGIAMFGLTGTDLLTVLLYRCRIEQNQSAGSGGGVYATGDSGASVGVAKCSIVRNTSGGAGGVASIGGVELTVFQTYIAYNHATTVGGISASSNARLMIGDCIITNNWADSGPRAIAINAVPEYVIELSTVAMNGPSGSPNAAISVAGSTGQVHGSIVWGHQSKDLSGCSATYSCIEDTAISDTGVMHTDPKFYWDGAMHGWRLAADSPCKDTVERTSDSPPVDFDGNPRFQKSVSTAPELADMGAFEIASYEVERWSGADRYKTACAAWETLEDPAWPRFRWAVLATGENFPDALSASALAGAIEGPLLLTRRDSLPASVTAFLEDHQIRGVYIVGGTGAVSSAVQTELLTHVDAVTRISGADRYATAANVAREVKRLAFPDTNASKVMVARGDSFPDALAAAPMAYTMRYPIVLTRTTALPDQTRSVLADLAPEHVAILGGTGAVSNAVELDIEAIVGYDAQRFSGTDRYETAKLVADDSLRWGATFAQRPGIATGQNFPDGLSGGAALGALSSPLLLTRTTSLPPYTHDYLDALGTWAHRVIVIGGTGAVSSSTAAAALAAIR